MGRIKQLIVWAAAVAVFAVLVGVTTVPGKDLPEVDPAPDADPVMTAETIQPGSAEELLLKQVEEKADAPQETPAPEAAPQPEVKEEPKEEPKEEVKESAKEVEEPAVAEDTAEPAQEEAPVQQVTASSGSSSVDRVLELVNAYRADYGLAPLTLSDALCSAAATRAQESTISFSHTRPDGSSCFTVSSLACGENMAMGTDMTADGAVSKWMNSSSHRDNILDRSFRTLGVGYCSSGREVYWIQLFGR